MLLLAKSHSPLMKVPISVSCITNGHQTLVYVERARQSAIICGQANDRYYFECSSLPFLMGVSVVRKNSRSSKALEYLCWSYSCRNCISSLQYARENVSVAASYGFGWTRIIAPWLDLSELQEDNENAEGRLAAWLNVLLSDIFKDQLKRLPCGFCPSLENVLWVMRMAVRLMTCFLYKQVASHRRI